MSPAAVRQLEEVKTSETASFLREKQLEAQVFLLRGYLHEVNNALAGIGTLAEVMKGMGADTLVKNLDLMASATQRSASLQRRIRAFYTEINAPTSIEVGVFLHENSDLLQLMLPHSQRLTFEIGNKVSTVETSVEKLWGLFAVIVMWVRHSAATKAEWVWSETGRLSVRLIAAQKTIETAQWKQGLALAGQQVGVSVFAGGEFLEIQFA